MKLSINPSSSFCFLLGLEALVTGVSFGFVFIALYCNACMVGVSNVSENPELQAKPLPESEKERRDELANVWRNAKKVFQSQNNSNIEEIIKAHEDGKTQ